MITKFMARVFLPNPGGAYDPAPLHEFDVSDGEFVPGVGDIIRDHHSGGFFRVTSRYFDLEINRAAIFVERWQGMWPEELR
jgi:hypothetical protein